MFLKIDEEMMKKMEDFWENTVGLWGREMDKTTYQKVQFSHSIN